MDETRSELLAEVAELRKIADELADLLGEAALQIEYMHNKFQATGTGASVIVRADTVLAKYESLKETLQEIEDGRSAI